MVPPFATHHSPVQVVPSGVVSVSVRVLPYRLHQERRFALGYGLQQLWRTRSWRHHAIATRPCKWCHRGVVSVSAGTHFTTFIKSDGSLWGMGYNAYGELGDGTTTQRNTPIEIISSGVVSVSAGHYVTRGSSRATARSGLLVTTTHGELGDGTTTHRHTPLQMVSSGVASAARGLSPLGLPQERTVHSGRTGYNH